MDTLTEPHPAWPERAVLDLEEASDDVAGAVSFIAGLPAREQALIFDRPVRLGADPEQDVTVLRVLAAAVSAFVQVDWILEGGLPPSWLPLRNLVHLPPPRPDGSDLVTTWRERFVFGLCGYRRGPGFVSIHDVRPGGTKYHISVPGGELFLQLAGSDRTPDDPAAAELLDRLGELGLVLMLAPGRPFVLPYHVYRWPVPGRIGAAARTGYDG